MGIEDRDWYREAQRERRALEARRERLGLMRARTASEWAAIRLAFWRTVVNSLAVYGALHLFVRVVRWASG